MAILAAGLERYDEAITYFDSMQDELKILQRNAPEQNLLDWELYTEYITVLIFAGMKQFEKASEALTRMEAMIEPNWEGSFYMVVVHETYYRYYHATGNFQKALEHINSLLRYLEDDTQSEYTTLSTKLLKARLFFDMGAYRNAAETYSELITRRDSLNTRQFISQINELRTIYELDRAELEAERQHAKIRQQRIIIIAALGGCILLAVIVACVAWNRKRIAQKNLALYRRIKEQDKTAEKYEELEKEYTLLKKTCYQTDDEKTDSNDVK